MIVAAAPFLKGAANAPIYLGVLEPPSAHHSNEFHVRVAFRFEDGRWRAMPHDAADQDALAKITSAFPNRVSWTIALHGRKLGEVTSERSAAYSAYSDIGVESLAAGADVPKVREGSADFTTWMGTAPFRPLVAVSVPNYRDPENWTPFEVSSALRTQAIAAFRRQTRLDMNCDGHPTRNYPDSNIEIFGRPRRSRRGEMLIALRPDPRLNRCEGPAGDEWQSVWFLAESDHFRWIGNALTILDIGDFNGDGAAEVLFQYDGYDNDGYMLLDPATASQTTFSWSYQ